MKEVDKTLAFDLMLGTLDALLAISLAFVNAGLLTRADLAEAIEKSRAHQVEQPINSPARRVALEILQTFFAAPVVGGGDTEAQRRRRALRAIEGDREERDEDQPPPGAA